MLAEQLQRPPPRCCSRHRILFVASSRKTRESQYQVLIEAETSGLERLGLMTSESWRRDPKHLVFTLSRYKFVAQMLAGRESVLEIGCGDAFGTRIVRQQVKSLTAVDFDPVFIEEAEARRSAPWTFDPVSYTHLRAHETGRNLVC